MDNYPPLGAERKSRCIILGTLQNYKKATWITIPLWGLSGKAGASSEATGKINHQQHG